MSGTTMGVYKSLLTMVFHLSRCLCCFPWFMCFYLGCYFPIAFSVGVCVGHFPGV